MAVTTCIFDAYGTLFDVDAAARDVALGRPEFAAAWQDVSADWRAKQLQYTWLRAVIGDHADFWQVTQDGLDWALEKAGLGASDLRRPLLELYTRLPAYPEVPDMLAALKADGLATGILSNGTPVMLASAVDSAGLGPHVDALLSVEEAGVFKPDDRVYDLVPARFGCAPEEVLFVSANGWDAAAAAAYGFRTLWVNRAGLPVDRLPGQPQTTLADLSGVARLATGA